MFYKKQIDGKDVYCSDMIETEHFFTSRDLIVKDNVDVISSYLGIESKNLIHPIQTHSDNVQVVEENVYDYPNTDALILTSMNKAIYLNFADCTPVIIYDYKNNIGAIAHAGWRGTAERIVQKTVLKMQKIYGTNVKNIVCAIGPCIGFDEFETYTEALKRLKASINKINTPYFRDNYVDLKGLNKEQLNEIGVYDVDVCPYCTVRDNDKFFSYRKENKTTNRHSAVLKLR